VGHGRLGLAEWHHEVAHADLPVGGRGEHGEDPQPYGVSEGLETSGQVAGVVRPERRLEDGRAAHLRSHRRHVHLPRYLDSPGCAWPLPVLPLTPTNASLIVGTLTKFNTSSEVASHGGGPNESYAVLSDAEPANEAPQGRRTGSTGVLHLRTVRAPAKRAFTDVAKARRVAASSMPRRARQGAAPPARPKERAPVARGLPLLDRFLPVWILLAMALGIGLGRAVPSLNRHLDAAQVAQGTSLPIFVGLLVMMYPVLAKVRYGRLASVTRDRRMLASSLVLNWAVGPAVMFALAWLLLPDLPTYRTGLIIVGLARCIAMVLVWNELSCGDREAAAVLVALNSLFQVAAFAFLGYFYLRALPGWLGLPTTGLRFSFGRTAETVAIFLGVPLVAGYLTRAVSERAKGRAWYEEQLLPRLGPLALYGLLYTVVTLFALQGHTITARPGGVARIALPLLCYFAVMWFGSFAIGRALRLPYERTVTLAFTAAGNNFELAIAVCIGVFGVTSGEALAGVVGPLIEVPVLVSLVYIALWARRRYPPMSPGGDGWGGVVLRHHEG
jgi:ACR3 family arsenite transporter